MNENYLNEQYKKDLDLYQKSASNCLCNKTMSAITEKNLLKEFEDFQSFIIVSFELNLLNQIFFNYFSSDLDALKNNLPEFLDCRCNWGSRPTEIFRLYKDFFPYEFNKLKIEDIVFWDTIFLEKLKDLITAGVLKVATVEELTKKIKSDSDSNPEKILSLFN